MSQEVGKLLDKRPLIIGGEGWVEFWSFPDRVESRIGWPDDSTTARRFNHCSTIYEHQSPTSKAVGR